MAIVRSITITTACEEDGQEAGAVIGHTVEARVEVEGEERVHDVSSVNPTITSLVEELVSAVHQQTLHGSRVAMQTGNEVYRFSARAKRAPGQQYKYRYDTSRNPYGGWTREGIAFRDASQSPDGTDVQEFYHADRGAEGEDIYFYRTASGGQCSTNPSLTGWQQGITFSAFDRDDIEGTRPVWRYRADDTVNGGSKYSYYIEGGTLPGTGWQKECLAFWAYPP